MIKVESDMLVLDSSFTKEDVLAINHFIEIAKRQECERIVKLLEEQGCDCHNAYCDKLPTAALDSLIALIKGENK